MVSRRKFLQSMGATGAVIAAAPAFGLFGPGQRSALAAPIPGGTLPPGAVNKYVLPLIKPPAMPLSNGSNKNKAKYKIAVRQFKQRILSPGHPKTGSPVISVGERVFVGGVGGGRSVRRRA